MFKSDLNTSQNINISDEVNCPVCLETYTISSTRNPVMVPSCGHTLCRVCTTSICSTAGEHLCPICRVPYEGALPCHLPPNYTVMSLLQKLNTKDIEDTLSIQPSAPPLVNEEHQEEPKLLPNNNYHGPLPGRTLIIAPPLVNEEHQEEPKLLPNNNYHGPLPGRTLSIAPPLVNEEHQEEPKLWPVNDYHGPLPDQDSTEDKFCIKCGEKMVPWTLKTNCQSCADFPGYNYDIMNPYTHINMDMSSNVNSMTLTTSDMVQDSSINTDV